LRVPSQGLEQRLNKASFGLGFIILANHARSLLPAGPFYQKTAFEVKKEMDVKEAVQFLLLTISFSSS
jgi:hypothetical protein